MNGNIYGSVGIKRESGNGRYDLYHSGASGNICSSDGNVERFEVQYCTMKNISNGIFSGAQFDVYLGTRNPTGSTLYMNRVETASDMRTKLYFDNNNNYIIDIGDTGYEINCPGPGHPYAIHDIQNKPAIIQTWFRTDIGGQGENYTMRYFWQSRISIPETKHNPNWGSSGAEAKSVVQSEAFWCANTTGWTCPTGGIWQVGAGNIGVKSDGLSWPIGSGVQYGRNIWHAKDIAPFWWQDAWYPSDVSDGVDRADLFLGCPAPSISIERGR